MTTRKSERRSRAGGGTAPTTPARQTRISRRVARGLLSLLLYNTLEANKLYHIMELESSKQVYPYLKYWIRIGYVSYYRYYFINKYYLTGSGRAFISNIMKFLQYKYPDRFNEDPALRLLYERLKRLGARKPVYKAIVTFLYKYNRMTNKKYFRAETIEKLLELIAQALEDYSIEEIEQALEELHSLGIIQYNRPRALTKHGRSKITAASIAFTNGFVYGTGLAAVT